MNDISRCEYCGRNNDLSRNRETCGGCGATVVVEQPPIIICDSRIADSRFLGQPHTNIPIDIAAFQSEVAACQLSFHSTRLFDLIAGMGVKVKQ